MTEPSPLDGLRHAAEELVGELSAALPRLVERTREQLSIVMSLAERLPCAGRLGGLSESVAPATPDLHVVVDPPSGSDDGEIEVSRVAPAPLASTPSAPAKKTAPAKKAAATHVQPSLPGTNQLAIPDYDQLAASQVIPRLESLTPTELEAVRAYEAAHRGRRTILGGISQLQGA